MTGALPVWVALTLLVTPASCQAALQARRRRVSGREKRIYDTSIRAFSPEGAIYQVEYAKEAVNKGSLALGIQVKDGVVLAAHIRKHSPLLKKSSVSKISSIDGHLICAMSGLPPDGRFMVQLARSVAQDHWFEYDEPAGVEHVALQLSNQALRFHGYDNGKDREQDQEEAERLAMARPMGVGLLLAGREHDGPALFHCDPSGAYLRWRAKAMGAGSAQAESKLDEASYEDMSLADAKRLAVQVFQHVLEDSFQEADMEMVCMDTRQPVQQESNDRFPLRPATPPLFQPVLAEELTMLSQQPARTDVA